MREASWVGIMEALAVCKAVSILGALLSLSMVGAGVRAGRARQQRQQDEGKGEAGSKMRKVCTMVTPCQSAFRQRNGWCSRSWVR